MNRRNAKSRKSNRTRIKSPLFLPEELILQILSYLPVKSLMQLKCVSKAWNTFISDPKFIKLHLEQSKKNTQILCMSRGSYILPFSLNTLLSNPSVISSTKNYFPSDPDYQYQFIGSCNGLFCFLLLHMTKFPRKFLFQLWNPATNTLSHKFVQQFHSRLFSTRFAQQFLPMIYGLLFGYDNSTDTYKIVHFESNKLEIFSLCSNVLKIIKLPHMSPLQKWDYDSRCRRRFLSDAVYLNDTINLLVRENAKQIVIISLNLNTDTYTKLLPPQDFVEDPLLLPTIHVLEDSLYFSHHTQKTHFIIWKMKEFGIDKSWTQFLKVSYEDLDIHIKYEFFLAPLCLYENCSIALVKGETDGRLQVIVYNWFENRIEKTRMVKRMNWMFNQNYVESLVPTS